MKIILKELDLSKCCETPGKPNYWHWHPDIDIRKTYLIKWGGHFYSGKFSEQWFGYSLHSGVMLHQLDKPGWNHSQWQGIWEIDENNS